MSREDEAAALVANVARTSPTLALALRSACEFTLWTRRENGYPIDAFDRDLQAAVDAWEADETRRQRSEQERRERERRTK